MGSILRFSVDRAWSEGPAQTGRLREKIRAENSHLPIRRRERKMQGSNPLLGPAISDDARRHLQHLQHERHLISRKTLRTFRADAHAAWATATAFH